MNLSRAWFSLSPQWRIAEVLIPKPARVPFAFEAKPACLSG